MLAVVYVVQVTLPFSPLIGAVLGFLVIFLAVRFVIRVWDLIGV